MRGEGESEDKWVRYRDRRRKGPARTPEPCHSWQAYKRHVAAIKAGEPHGCPDLEKCKAKYNKYHRDARLARLKNPKKVVERGRQT